MKKQNKYFLFTMRTIAFCLLLMISIDVVAQNAVAADSAAPAKSAKKKAYVKNTFEGNYIIDNQTVMVPIKGTFEFDIQHRFATWEDGFSNLFGLFGGATMRLGFSYVPINNLQIGFGASNENMLLDFNAKYALLKQTKDGSMPVSVTYFGNVMADPRKKDATTLFVTTSDRFSFFNQIIIARKITDRLSVQVSPSLTHFNNLEGYTDEAGKIQPKMKNDHFAISFSGKYRITEKTTLIANYDQPLTQHPMDNPHPNISFGIEMKTSGHDFQVFAGNYGAILPQNNNMFNQNDFTKNQFLIGFNISRLWNF
jgi:hypothetical protein